MIRPEATPIRQRDPTERVKDFGEVTLGYTPEEAIQEAQRCLLCKRPSCVGGCPAGNDIPGFIQRVAQGDFAGALEVLRRTTVLPAICGRVCPHEVQCQGHCVLAKKFEAVRIGALERFVADWAREQGLELLGPPGEPTGFKVAVVGSGPAGIGCAAFLRRLGHEVVIFEGLHRPGGVLIYGIPEFRLPHGVVDHVLEELRRIGVRIVTGVVIGRTLTVQELFERGFHAVFLGTGAEKPQFLGIPGEELAGVYSANELLMRVNLFQAHLFPEYDTPVKVGERVAVIGGGNTAIDAARTALRLGARKVMVLYRRSQAEMPAFAEEVEAAREEGVEFHFLTTPVRFLGKDGKVTAVECVRMELGEPDESGRRRPIPIPDSTYTISIDMAILAIGTRPDPLITSTVPGFALTRWGTIETDGDGYTGVEGIFAGGDLVTGPATVVAAMAAGRRAAHAIDRYLREKYGGGTEGS